MSIFGNILSSIFNSASAAEPSHESQAQAGGATTSAAPSGASPQQQAGSQPSGSRQAGSQQTASTPQTSAPTSSTAAAPKPSGPVDIAAVLDDLTKRSGEKDIQWRKSIVDLMKVLKLDSGLAARKQLAKELHYTGSTKDTSTMNVWLHKQVMTKLGENGGVVPEELKN